jgi:hypothetical protein
VKKKPNPHNGEPGALHLPGNSNDFPGSRNARHLRDLPDESDRSKLACWAARIARRGAA